MTNLTPEVAASYITKLEKKIDDLTVRLEIVKRIKNKWKLRASAPSLQLNNASVKQFLAELEDEAGL